MLLAVLVIAVAAGVGWQWYTAAQLQQTIDARLNQLQSARQQQAQAQHEQAWWAQHQADYQHLVETGFVGADARVRWHQQLSQLALIQGVHHAEFDIAARTPHQPEQHTGKRTLMDSVVRWRGEVAHEGVLVALLTQLANSKPGLLRVRSCDLTHAQDDAPIAVDCEFVWQVLELQ